MLLGVGGVGDTEKARQRLYTVARNLATVFPGSYLLDVPFEGLVADPHGALPQPYQGQRTRKKKP